MTSPVSAGAVPVVGAAIPEATTNAAEDLRLARLHLRLGMLAAARAELEDLEHRGALNNEGLASLAEARWRNGELEAAAAVAERHLAEGGGDLVAIVVAAEAAAANGDPAEARSLVGRAARTDVATIEAIFAGMPRRAQWPAAAAPEATAAEGGNAETSAATAGTPGVGQANLPVTEGGLGGLRASAVPTPADVIRANAGLWDEAAIAASGASRPPVSRPHAAPTWVEPARAKSHADPVAELDAARDELAAAPERGLLRLALVLRLDPTLAGEVFDVVRLRRDPAAAIIRGDAERLMGRHLEAEAAFGEAMESIERAALGTRHQDEPGHGSRREPGATSSPEPGARPDAGLDARQEDS